MNEENISTEQIEETTDILAGWDDEPAETAEEATEDEPVEVDEPDEDTDETASEDAEENEQEPTDKSTPDTEDNAEEPGEAFKPIEVRYNGETKTVSNELEAVTLIQKGMNYDKVHDRMETAEASVKEHEGAIDLLTRLAAIKSRQDGKEYTLAEYVERTNIDLLMTQGMTETQARKELELAKRESSLNEKETAPKTQEQSDNTQRSVAEDKAVFEAAFPDVKISDIPKEVFEDLASNRSQGLTAAYAKYLARTAKAEADKAKAEAEKAKAKADSRKRSPGSMRNTQPKGKSYDPILEGWD